MTPHAVAITVLGTRLVLKTADPTTAAEIRRLWRPFLDMADSTQPSQIIAVTAATMTEQLAQFATAVNAAALDASADLAIHAGVVAHGNVAIAMPATSGTGKSTLTAACLCAGFDYLSDEALCLRYADGSVRPYPRPIALSPWSAAAIGAGRNGIPAGTAAGNELLFTAADLRGSRAMPGPNRGETTRLGHVVILDRRPGSPSTPAVRPALVPTPRPLAVSLLLRMSFNHYRRPADAVRLAAEAVTASRVWTLRYGEPLVAAALLWSTFIDGRPDGQPAAGSSD